MTRLRYCLTFACGILLAAGLQAHHSTRGIYLDGQNVELTGKVVEWRFINPHPFLIIEAEDDNGELQQWDVSYGGAAVIHLRRQGYAADTFQPGETIVVQGKPARTEGVYGLLIEGIHPTRADGSQVVEGGSMF